MLGLPEDTVRLIPYTPEWEGVFREEKVRIQAAIGSYSRRHYFQRGNSKRTHHLHLVEINSDDHERTLRFRDYLRQPLR